MSGMNKGDYGLKEGEMARLTIRQRKNRSMFSEKKNSICDQLNSLSRYQPMISESIHQTQVYQELYERTIQFFIKQIGTLYPWVHIMNLAKKFRYILMAKHCTLLTLRQEKLLVSIRFQMKKAY